MKTLYGGQLRRQQVVGSRWSSAGGHHCCITGLTVNVEELSTTMLSTQCPRDMG